MKKHHGHHDGHHGHHEMHGRPYHEDNLKGRHHRKRGGRAMEGDIAHDPAPHDVYAGAGSEVVKEAERKHGGRTKHHMKHLHAHGEHAKHRLDRPARKHGGKVGGAEMHPFSAAHNVKTPAGRQVEAGES